MKKNKMELYADYLRLSEAIAITAGDKDTCIFFHSYYIESEYIDPKSPQDSDIAYGIRDGFMFHASYNEEKDVWVLEYDNPSFTDPYSTLFDSDWMVYLVNKVAIP